jgi:hypothetical protein
MRVVCLLWYALNLSACGGSASPDDAGDTGGDADADADVRDGGGDADDGGDDAEIDAEIDAEVDADGDVPTSWGEPIEAPAREWTWVDFPETQCANGSATGLGVNLSPGADMAFIYLEGGGACWDYSSCFGVVPTSMHLGGFDGDDFDGLMTSVYLNMALLDRDDPTNPLADAHQVFIPYCTGDVFSGDAVVELAGVLPWERETIHFHGARNMQEYLARLVPTFEGVTRVILSGSSAGGFGAGLAWYAVQEAFGDVRVDVLDDSGPPIRAADGLWEAWVETWNMQFPPGCAECATGIESVVDYSRRELMARGRYALLSYHTDLVISNFFRLEPAIFEERLDVLLDTLDEEPGARYFVVDGVTHTMLVAGYDLVESSDGMPLWRWVEQMIDDDPEWTSRRP